MSGEQPHVGFSLGNEAKIISLNGTATEMRFYVTQDSRKMFIRLYGQMVKIGDIETLKTDAERQMMLAPLNKLHYVEATGGLFRFNANGWEEFLTSVRTENIIDKAITNEKLSDMPSNTIIGRISSDEGGKPGYLTAEQVREWLNISEDGSFFSQYEHPLNHPPNIITQDEHNRFVTDEQIESWDSKAEWPHQHNIYDLNIDLNDNDRMFVKRIRIPMNGGTISNNSVLDVPLAGYNVNANQVISFILFNNGISSPVIFAGYSLDGYTVYLRSLSSITLSPVNCYLDLWTVEGGLGEK